MDTFDEAQKRKKLTWPVIALMDFVTVIGFDDIIYNFQNQELAVVSDWILLLILFVVPYELIVGQLGARRRRFIFLAKTHLWRSNGLYYSLVLLGSFIALLG